MPGIFTFLKAKMYTIIVNQWYDGHFFYRVKNKNIDGQQGVAPSLKYLCYKHRELRLIPRTHGNIKV